MRSDKSVLIYIRERDGQEMLSKIHEKSIKYDKGKGGNRPCSVWQGFDLFCADIVQKKIIENIEIR